MSENPRYSDLLELCHRRRRPHTRCIVWPGGRIPVSPSAFESFWTLVKQAAAFGSSTPTNAFFLTSFLRCVPALCLLMAAHSCGSASIKTPPSSVSNGEAVLAASNHPPAVGARRTACAPPPPPKLLTMAAVAATIDWYDACGRHASLQRCGGPTSSRSACWPRDG